MKHCKWCVKGLIAIAAAGMVVAAACLVWGVSSQQKPVVYVADDTLRVHDGRKSRVVSPNYNSSTITSSTQLSKNGKKLYYIAPAGIAGTLYCADTDCDAEGPGTVLAQNASGLKISPDGSSVVYQNAAMELYYIEKGKPAKLDTAVREVLQVSNQWVLYSKYSQSAATGQALYICRLKGSEPPQQVSDDFEMLIEADESLSGFYYQAKTPDLGNDPSCHNLFYYRSAKGENQRLLRNVAEIYQVAPNGVVLFSVQSEGGITLETALTDPYAEADAALQAPAAGSAKDSGKLSAYQQKQVRDAAREAMRTQMERAVKMEVFCCRPEEYSATKPSATYVGEVAVLDQGEEGVFFSVADWSGVKFSIDEILTPQQRQEVVAQRAAVTFCGVTVGGGSANLCKTAKGVFRKDSFQVDWLNHTVRFLGYTGADSGTGTLYEAAFRKKRIEESVKIAENVSAVSANGLCMEMLSQNKLQLYTKAGVPIRFDGTVVPETSVRLLAHTDHCCAAFYKNEGTDKSYTLYSIRNGSASHVSDEAGGTLYLRGKKEFLYLEQVEETTGKGRLVLCRPHRQALSNIQLDTGATDVLAEQGGKVSLTTE